MKQNGSLATIVFLIITILILTVVDLVIANQIYRVYEPIAKGILSLVLLTLAYLYIMPKRIVEEPIRAIFTIRGLKLSFAVIFWAIIIYWALIPIFDMVYYLIKLVRGI